MVLNGDLPQQVYPFLRERIESLPEAVATPNRPTEKIPGSDYVHSEGSKPYVPLVRENPTFVSPDLSTNEKTNRTKDRDTSSPFVSCFIGFVVTCIVAYGVGSWYMGTPSKKKEPVSRTVAEKSNPPENEAKVDTPIEEVADDIPPEKPAPIIVTDNPFENDSVSGKYYRVVSKQLLDPNGKPVRLRGFMLDSFLAIEPEDIQDMKETGTNFVLYCVGLDFPDDKYKLGSFDERHVNHVKMLTDAGILVIVSVFGRSRDWSVDFRPYNSREFHKEILAQWKEMIEKLDDNPGVIGWGIFWSTNWFYKDFMRGGDEMMIELNEYLLTEIRKLDPHRPIVLPGIEWVFTGDPPKIMASNAMLLPPFEHWKKFYADAPLICTWGDLFTNKDFSTMKNLIATAEERELSLVYDCWFPRRDFPHGGAIKKDMTEKVELMTKAMKTPDKFNSKSSQFEPDIWSTNERIQVCLFDKDENELKPNTDETEFLPSGHVRRPFRFNETDKIFLEYRTDSESGVVVYRVDSPHLKSGDVSVGFRFADVFPYEETSIHAYRATFSCKYGKMLIGWNDAKALNSLKPRKTLEIIEAKYGTDDHRIDVTEKIRQSVIDNTLNFSVINSLLGDPAHGRVKNLALTYALDGERQTVTVDENKIVHIQAEKEYHYYCFRNMGKTSFEFVASCRSDSLPEKLPSFSDAPRKEIVPDKPLEDDTATKKVDQEINKPEPKEKLGRELLSVTSFENGYMPDGRQCNWKYRPTTKAKIRNIGNALEFVCIESDFMASPRLDFGTFSVKKGKRYRIRFEMKSNEGAVVRVSVSKPQQTAKLGYLKDWKMNDSWKTYEATFVATENEPKAILSFFNFQKNSVYALRRVSLREVSL